MSSLEARRVSGSRAATTPTTRSSGTPAVKSAEARRAKKNTRRKATRARKQERKQEALSRQGGAARGLRRQHQEQQAGEEKQRERGSAARVIQTAVRARFLSQRSTERPQRVQDAQTVPEACPESIKWREEVEEGDEGLGRGDIVGMAEPPAEDRARAKDGNIATVKGVPPVATATTPLPAAVTRDGVGRAAATTQKKNAKRKEARVKKRERPLEMSAVQDGVRRESAAAAAGTIQAAWRRSLVRARCLWAYPLRAGERRQWAARVISNFLQVFHSGRVESTWAGQVAPGVQPGPRVSVPQTAGGTGPEVELGDAGALGGKSRQGATTVTAEAGEEALVPAASCQQGVHAAVVPDDSDDRARMGEGGDNPPQAPASSNPSPLASRTAATGSAEEKRLKNRTEHDEELAAEAGRGIASARHDAQATARHQASSPETIETVDSWSKKRRAARVIAGACHAYAKGKRVVGVTEPLSSSLGASTRVEVEPRAEEARAPEGAHKLITEGHASPGDDKIKTPTVKADNIAVASAAKIDGDGAVTKAVAEATVEWAAAAKLEQAAGGLEAKMAEREALENLLLAKVLQALKERQAKVGMDVPAAESAERASSDHLPPAPRQAKAPAAEPLSSSPEHIEGSPRSSSRRYVSHPLQVVEGKILLYDPEDFDLWELMTQLRGWSLALGAAPVWGGGNEREAEVFSAVCGFSAAWGPAVLKRVAVAVYGRVFAGGVSVLSADHVVYAFGRYWDREVAPYDPEERFFRLVKAGSNNAFAINGGLRKVR